MCCMIVELLFLYRANVVARPSAASAEAISRFARYFNSKGDCRAAKEQERQLATTSIYEMYGNEIFI